MFNNNTHKESVGQTTLLLWPLLWLYYLFLITFLNLNYWSLTGTSSTKDAGNIPVFPLHCPSNQSWLTK